MIAPQLKEKENDVFLSSFRPEDITSIYVNWLKDKKITQFTEISDDNQTLKSCTKYIEVSNSSPDVLFWRIMVKNQGHVGNIRLSGLSSPHNRGELALIIGKANLHGLGIGSKAITLATNYAFSKLNLHKLTAGMYMQNQGSYKAFLKAGYHQEATFKDHALLNGKYTDVTRVACFNHYELNQ